MVVSRPLETVINNGERLRDWLRTTGMRPLRTSDVRLRYSEQNGLTHEASHAGRGMIVPEVDVCLQDGNAIDTMP